MRHPSKASSSSSGRRLPPPPPRSGLPSVWEGHGVTRVSRDILKPSLAQQRQVLSHGWSCRKGTRLRVQTQVSVLSRKPASWATSVHLIVSIARSDWGRPGGALEVLSEPVSPLSKSPVNH